MKVSDRITTILASVMLGAALCELTGSVFSVTLGCLGGIIIVAVAEAVHGRKP